MQPGINFLYIREFEILYDTSNNINRVIGLFDYKCFECCFNHFVCVGEDGLFDYNRAKDFKNVQFRKDPNKVGFLGLLQSFSDDLKLLNKEGF